MYKTKLKMPLNHSDWHVRMEVGQEYEWSLDEDVKLYNIYYTQKSFNPRTMLETITNEIVFSLKPEKFFYYFEARAEQRRMKLNRVLKNESET